MKKRIFVRVM